MNLVTRLLLDLTRLSALAQADHRRFEVAPPATLLHAVLGGTHGESQQRAAELAFGGGQGQAAALAQLSRELERVLREQEALQQVMQLTAALETLLIAAGVLRERSLHAATVKLSEPLLFDALRLLRLGAVPDAPQHLLVGTLASAQTGLAIPLGLAAPLERLELIYEAALPTPQLRTDLWLRVPPDPNLRRLEDWTPAELAMAGRVELYRRRIPGPVPDAIIVSERVALPHTLNSGPCTLHLLDASGSMSAIRTTVQNKFKDPLVIIERILVQQQHM
jgi:hypothetical protein